MEFYEMVRQAAALLQQQGKLTYRTLRRQFALDDETLEDLKEELLFSHPVVDEDGRGLVWTGETEAAPVTLSQPGQPESVVEQAQLVQEPSLPTEPHTPDAERRQLTVMFCDLVDSTALSGRLDPEDLREVIKAYQAACDEVIQRFDGYVAQHLGDGLLIYFGYPAAHEDDAQRAVRAGLGIIDAMQTLNQQLKQAHGIELAVRIGIHTGLVVIGDIGAGARQEQLALGETPNVAARIEGLAEANTVVISHATYQLVEGYFEHETLGEHLLRGVTDPMVVYRVLRASGVQSRLDIASAGGLTPLVGRESEVALLLDRWGQVQDGRGQVVLLGGEAGIGKSRLVQVLKEHVATTSHTRLECRSSSYYQNTALYPYTDMLQRIMRWEQDDTAEAKLHKLEAALGRYDSALDETVPLLAGLLSLPLPEDRYAPLSLTPQRQRQKTLETIVTTFVEESKRQPVLFIVEDLHWTDPTTLELLELLIDQSATASILILLTCRPEFEPTWSHRMHLAELSLSRLSQAQIEQMVERVTNGKRLPDKVVRELIEKTDGVPLYLEEMTKVIIESGMLKEREDHYELVNSVASLAIPATLQDSLMARLDRLASAKGVAQLGAVIGRQFSYELIEAVSEFDEDTLRRELRRLNEAELVYQRGLPPIVTYMFKHALIQDAAYQSLLRRTRQQYHQRIAQVLETQFPEVVETQPELVAHHYTEAGQDEVAIGYWQHAGQRAIARSANSEAIAHLRQGLAGLMTLPETPERLQQELDLQAPLSQALRLAKGMGHPEVKQACDRALELCQRIGDSPQLFLILRGLISYYRLQGLLQTARQLEEQLLRLAQAQSDPEPLILAHFSLGQNIYFQGELTQAQAHHDEALTIYHAQEDRTLGASRGTQFGVSSQFWLARELWCLGYPDRALRHVREALALAQTVSHPYTSSWALYRAAMEHQYLRDASVAQAYATDAKRLASEHGFAQWLAMASAIHGWALAMQGQSEQGIVELRQGLADSLSTESRVWQPYLLGRLAEAYGESGHAEKGLPPLAEAMDLIDTLGLRIYGAELHLLKGELLLKQAVPNISEAETCFHDALELARAQQAKSWELRAAASLAKLWQSQGKHQEAYDLLALVYGWFTEGFDTTDLIEAKTLLDELAGGPS